MVEARSQDHNESTLSRSSSCESVYSNFSDRAGIDHDQSFYIGSLPKTEEQLHEELRNDYAQELEQHREHAR